MLKTLPVIILISILLLLSKSVNSQKIMLEEDVRKYDIYKPKRGPNLARFNHLYLGYSLIMAKYEPSMHQSTVLVGPSHSLIAGNRFKYKLGRYFATGYDVYYTYFTYYIGQNQYKYFPNNVIHETEKIRFSNAGAEVYFRISPNKRLGNFVGNFIDFGAYLNYMFQAKHIYYEKAANQSLYYAGKAKIILRNLSYVTPYNYGVKLRIGRNRISFNATYRVSDFIKKDFKQNELNFEPPRLSVGLQLGFF